MPAAPPGRPPDSPQIGLHTLSGTDVDSLALGRLDHGVVRRLLDAETSYRRLALRAALELLRVQPGAAGPLVPVDDAWELLVAAERRDPAAARAVIDRPFTGAWAARLLRRLRGQPSGAEPAGVHAELPLWVEVGYLHALAVATAVRAGCACTLAVPARRGVVHLPSLGHAHLAGLDLWDHATVEVTDAGARVVGPLAAVHLTVPGHPDGSDRPSDADRPGDLHDAPSQLHWRATRSLASGVTIEDVDPYRQVSGTAGPDWLPAVQIAEWESRLAAARRVLRAGHPRTAAALDATITAIVPRPAAQRFRSFSATSADAVGSVELSVPSDGVDGAVMLSHELRHAVLGIVTHLGDLLDPAAAARRYRVPWRDDPRPARGMLQGMYAFFGVADFWHVQRHLARGNEAMLAHFEFALWRGAVFDTGRELLRTGALTALGRRFVTGVVTTVRSWLTEPVPAEAGRLAELATTDARALWHVHHHLVARSQVARGLAAAWLAGAQVPPVEPAAIAYRLDPDPDARAFDTRACLARLWLADRDVFRRTEREGAQRVYRGASAADCALVRGDRDRARALYLAQLNRPGQHRRALVGLGLALGADHPAGRVLQMRPELVAAVTREVVRSDGPAAAQGVVPHLAAWLAPLVAPPSPAPPDA
ncbi:HEXXH motif domain-containing protein [Frankia sp. R82]|uniref:HEXXH motif domain-containing protein n=1 Tax=Frankia sp. R82 TaxID=2950553 RepID=UPI0020439352|nr:HEXXH motif domain-containing protein [Frankia sp. R82]MCM3882874.1 HEXXH motif domain-containing protein [Frankia sp. R82]